MISTYFNVFQDSAYLPQLSLQVDAWNPWTLKFSCCKASLGGSMIGVSDDGDGDDGGGGGDDYFNQCDVFWSSTSLPS